MFGIIWGIASVIILVGLGKGFMVDQKEHMKTLGKDLVIVWPGRTSSQAGGLAAGREITLTVNDASAIRDECYFVKNVSAELRRSVPEVSPFNSANRGVVGMWPSYQNFRSLLLDEGRLITDEDERGGRRVVILGYAARRQLYPGQPAIGATLLIKGLPYTVVGVLKQKSRTPITAGPITITCSRHIPQWHAIFRPPETNRASYAGISTILYSRFPIPNSTSRL